MFKISCICFCLLLQSASSLAQTSKQMIATVTYVELLPSAVQKVLDAFKTYREAGSKEAGYVRIELLQQMEQPGRWVILESWRDQEALAAHDAGKLSAQLQGAIQADRISSYDRRAYKALDVDTEKPINAQSIYVVTHVDIAGQQRGATELLQQHCLDSRQDAGNLRCVVWQSTTRSNHYTLVAIWKDQAAYLAYRASTHSRRFRDAVEPMTGSPIDERLYYTAQ
ncbi:MAG: antibiotic biosynthesis monooxygenase [Steroidobacteraceae bacterium]